MVDFMDSKEVNVNLVKEVKFSLFGEQPSKEVETIMKTISKGKERKFSEDYKEPLGDKDLTSNPNFQEYIGEALFRVLLQDPGIFRNFLH